VATRQEFRFVISGLELPEEQQQKVAGAIYRAAVGALAGLDLKGDTASIFVGKTGRFDFDWRGGLVGPVDIFEGGLDRIREIGQ
jgi:hypothetical protein